MSGPVTVLVVDDQLVFRRAVRRLLAAAAGFQLCGEAASGQEALRKAAELRPDLVLLDVRMPEMDGIETARRLADGGDDAVVVLISLDELPQLPSLTSVGVVAYLRKQELSVATLEGTWATHGRRP